MKKFKLVGLTGTTGSGKSTVRRFFEEAGYAVTDADLLARKAVEVPAARELIRLNFGDGVFIDGALDRRALARKAFSSPKNTEILNSIVHPQITPIFLAELKELSKTHDKILFDASQLFESGLDVICDFTVAVTAPEKLRLKRIIERDNLTADEAKRRIGAQFSDDFFEKNCDFTIANNSDLDDLRRQAESVINLI